MPVSSKEEQTRENCQLLFHLNFNSNFSVKFYYSKSCPSLLESVCKNMLLPTFMASDSTSCNDPSPCSQGFPECHSNCSYRAATLVPAARDGFGKANSTKHGVNKQTNTRKWKSFIFVLEKGQGPSSEALLHPCPPAPRGPPAPQTPLVPGRQLPALLPSSRSILLASPCLYLAGWASRQIKGKEPAVKEPAAQRATPAREGKAKPKPV